MSFNFPSAPLLDQIYGEYYWDGEKWSVTHEDKLLLEDGVIVSLTYFLLLETGGGYLLLENGFHILFEDGTTTTLPSLESLVGVTAATINMCAWGKDATYTDFSKADVTVNGHPGGYIKDGVTIGTLVAAPDGTVTGQHLTESSAAGYHRVWTFLGPQMSTRPNISFRAAAIVKAGARSRVVLAMEIYLHEGAFGASVGFDLAGGNVGYDVVAGTATSVRDATMTPLGDGWWLCRYDLNYTGTYAAGFTFNWNPKLYIDAGTGTTARNIAYTGDGTSGVHAWWLSLLPTGAWSLTTTAFRDDFDTLGTIDLTNSLSPGFNWYINNYAPNSLNQTWWSSTSVPPSLPGNFTISSPSVLQIYNPNVSAPKWGSMAYTVGFPAAGGFVGQDWQPPMFLDGMFQWNSTLDYSQYGGLGPALWSHTREGMESATSMNPTKAWMEWDVTDIGAQTAAVYMHRLNGTNIPDGGIGVSWVPTVSMAATDWHRCSGLWLNMAANGYGQGFFMHFFDGSFTQFSDVVYSASDFPQPPGSLPKGWNSQCEWQHMPLMMDTGNNVSAGGGGGWPMRVDYVRVVLHPTPPKIYDFWNIFDQLGDITVGNNGLQLTKTAAGTVWEAIRTSFGKKTGQWYWESTITGTVASSTSLMLGIMSEAASVASNAFPGSSAQGAGAQHGSNWNALVSGVTGAFSGTVTFASGDVFGFAFDADAGKVYVHRNGTWVNGTPASGNAVWTGLTGHTWYPAAAIHDASVATITTNFGSVAFAVTPPSGYLGLAAN